MEIAEFLLARISDDEAVARESDPEAESSYDQFRQWKLYEQDGLVLTEPARVLIECDVKRKIVAAMLRWIDTGHITLDHVLFQMARPYADHPDWREEWRP